MSKLTQNEQQIIKAIEGGHNTVETIAEKTSLSKNVVHLLCGSLCKNIKLRKSPNEKTFSIVDPNENREITVCYGNLLLPVKFYTNKSGNRYAIRGGTWNPIGENVTENDIEWIDDSDSIESKKSKTPPKDRSGMVQPTIKILAVPEFEQWSNLPLAEKQHSGSYVMENGEYRMKLDVLETKGDKTNIKAMIKIKIGKVDFPFYPTIKPEYLIETKSLTDFIKGTTKLPFTIEDFIWKDMKKVVYFPLSIQAHRDSSCEAELITFTKTKNKSAMVWEIKKYSCGAQSREGRFSKISTAEGTLEQAMNTNPIKSFNKALEGFKINNK